MTNDFLNKIGVLPSPACSFCGKENESFEHILTFVTMSKIFGQRLLSGIIKSQC